jgi:hypothetical protein
MGAVEESSKRETQGGGAIAVPEVDEGRGKGVRFLVHPRSEGSGVDPADLVHFTRTGEEGAFMAGEEDFDKFLVKGSGVRAIGDFVEVGGMEEAEFLAAFPAGGGEVVFAAVHMAAGGGIPSARVAVFGGGAELDEQEALGIKNPDMGGAVEVTGLMDHGARGRANDLVAFIDDVEDVFHDGKGLSF